MKSIEFNLKQFLVLATSANDILDQLEVLGITPEDPRVDGIIISVPDPVASNVFMVSVSIPHREVADG